MRILIWGTGDYAKYITDFVKREQNTIHIHISGYVDNDREKWNTCFEGYPVYPPAEIKRILNRTDYIVISVLKHLDEITSQCISQLAIPPDKILSYRLFYTKAQYRKRYKEEPGRRTPADTIWGKIAVYTANIGFYDNLQEPEFTSSNIDYYCFTDNKSYKSDIWNVRHISNSCSSPEENAKLVRHYKFFPGEYLPDYEISIWVDSKYKIIGDLRQYAALYSHGAPMLSFPHFFRDCIFEEAAICLDVGRGDPDMICNQIKNYRFNQYPPHHGLYENGCIVRRHKDKQVKRVMNDWWEEINQYSLRDQISLPYVLWKNNFLPDICDLDIEENEYLIKIGHKA
ncbi:glycosyltransferase domain-containing protein [Parablautia intestinalis]|uniref:glycosyltransferase domain-containing protein n=1 Tax=Parablautia intestinalis TaxID=2320100 RepID=UPI00259D068E|nr:glycosyltransferase domain-containing protein [Parablautia intestinalis]